MPDVSAERVSANAAAARVPLPDEAPARIARATTPMVTRFSAGPVEMPMEIEPSSFVAVQREDAGL